MRQWSVWSQAPSAVLRCSPRVVLREPRHYQHVACLKLVKQPAKLRTVGLGSALMHVAENLLASGLGQLPRLCVNALALAARRYPCIAVFHGSVRPAFTLDDIKGFLALVFQMAQSFLVGAERIDVCSEEKAVAGRAFMLCDLPHGFPNRVAASDFDPLALFVRHVQLPHYPPLPRGHIMHLVYAPKKPNLIRLLVLVHNS
jgi:hypothetical protein